MNRSALILASVTALLVVSTFTYGALAQAAQPLTAMLSDAAVNCKVQYAQYRSPGLFDRGSCELSCRDRYGGPSTWTRDNQQSGSTADYLRCTNQCNVKDWNELERSRNPSKLY